MNDWYRLDNAAKLFPSVTGIRNSSVFRVSAVLSEKIDEIILQQAVDDLTERYPMLFFKLKRGVFWNYLDRNTERFSITKEVEYPCRTIDVRKNRGYFIKVIYYGNRVSVEVFHSLTDGTGASEFLKSIIYRYFEIMGEKLESEGKVITSDSIFSLDEAEDSFLFNYDKKTAPPAKNDTAYRIKGVPFDIYGVNAVTGLMPASQLNRVAKEYNVTITAFLAAVMIYSIYNSQQKYTYDKKPIVAAVPVNLRKVFKSDTMRNFFGAINIGMQMSKDTSFSEIVAEVNRQLKEKTEASELQKIISRNIKLEKNIVSKIVPLVIKNLFIGLGFSLFGENKKTVSLSNIGRIEIPKSLSPFVKNMEFVVYPTAKSALNCGVVSVNDSLSITFSRTMVETDIIRAFFMNLAQNYGIDVNIYSNNWGEYNE